MHVAATLLAGLLLIQDQKVEDVVRAWQEAGGGSEFHATVSVVDGDTLRIRDVDAGGPVDLTGFRVRLCGIDTMEFADSSGKDASRSFEEPLADEAKEELKWALDVHRGEGTVRAKVIIGPRICGGYNRLLAWVKIELAGHEIDPTTILLERGLAVVWRHGGDADDPGYLWDAQLRAFPRPGIDPRPGTVWATLRHLRDSDDWSPGEHQFLHRYFRIMRAEGFQSTKGYWQDRKTPADKCKNKAAEKDMLRGLWKELEGTAKQKKPPAAKGDK